METTLKIFLGIVLVMLMFWSFSALIDNMTIAIRKVRDGKKGLSRLFYMRAGLSALMLIASSICLFIIIVLLVQQSMGM